MSNCKVKLLIVRTIKLTQHVLFILDKPREHPGSPWITQGPLLLASFGSRCRPTWVPKMAGKCAAVHHGRRCFVSEEQRDLSRGPKDTIQVCWILMCVAVSKCERSQGTCWAKPVTVCKLWRGAPELTAFWQSGLLYLHLPELIWNKDLEWLLKVDAYKECCMGFLSPHLSSHPPQETHNLRLCKSRLKLFLTSSHNVVQRRDFMCTWAGQLSAEHSTISQFLTSTRPMGSTF